MSALRGMASLAWAYLLETWRSKPTIFWNLVFPLLTLIGFSYAFGSGEAIPAARVIPGTMTINLLAAAFFGVSLYMVSLREQELYRRFWATPITPLAVVGAHAVTALANILISAGLQLIIAKALFHIQIRGTVFEMLAVLLLGAFAFIPLGLLVGSVARDMKTGPAISNLLFFPLSFLSGAAMPLYLMPGWLQRTAELLPSTYLVELMQAAILRGNVFKTAAIPAAVLLVTGLVGFACNALLFRWETRQPVNRRGLAIAVGSLALVYLVPFANHLKLQAAHAPEDEGTQSTAQHLGPDARILMGMTILDGTGKRIEHGQIVIEGNRIASVGTAPLNPPRGIPVTDLTGFYMIPGLIDSHIHLGGSGGGSATREEFSPSRVVHDLQVYLALGVTSFVSMADHVEDMQRLQRDVASGAMRSPRPYISGPVITAPHGNPATIFSFMPGFAEYMTRQVNSPQAAVQAVRELAALKVDIVKLYLDEGTPWEPLPVLSEPALQAAIQTAHELGLKTTVHVDSDNHARMAIRAHADGIEHIPPDLSDETIAELVRNGITLTPTLVAAEATNNALHGTAITDGLVIKWVEPEVLDSLRSPDSWIAGLRKKPEAVNYYTERYEMARKALRRSVAGHVTIIAGSDAGNAGTFHGPGLIRELELLVRDGRMSPEAAIGSATSGAATRLGVKDIGRIVPGAFADLVMLDGDPAKDIGALRNVRMVYLGGRPLRPETLLTSPPGNWRPLFSIPTQAETR